MPQDIRPEFDVHVLSEQGISKAQALARIFTAALNDIETLVPPGRDRALVVTKLQEASFFAKRAITTDPSNQATP